MSEVNCGFCSTSAISTTPGRCVGHSDGSGNRTDESTGQFGKHWSRDKICKSGKKKRVFRRRVSQRMRLVAVSDGILYGEQSAVTESMQQMPFTSAKTGCYFCLCQLAAVVFFCL